MAEIFEHVDDLPVTPQDGTACGIRIPSAHVEHLIYHAAENSWIGRAHWTMRTHQNEGFYAPGSPSGWKYPGQFAENPAWRTHATPQNFQIHLIHHAGELWAAGLRLQEHLSGMARAFTDVDGPAGMETGRPALSWYPLADGDPFLSPDSFNHGVRLIAPQTDDLVTFRQCSSGWQNFTEVDEEPDTDEHLYPEIYMAGPQTTWREFTARHRWVAGDVGGAGGAEDASSYPIDMLAYWYRAEHIPVDDGDPVAEWGDQSGRTFVLQQTDSSKRPVVMRDGVIRFVRFDGSNDFLTSRVQMGLYGGSGGQIQASQPYAIFAVMRQRASGAATQVWFARSVSSGAPLVFRNDNTDLVHVWLGGTDATYHGSDWPTPWMVWSMIAPGDGTVEVREGTTLVHSGAVGSNTWNGLTIGAAGDGTLPAAIDVAEFIFCFKLPSSGERNAVIDMLETRYGL